MKFICNLYPNVNPDETYVSHGKSLVVVNDNIDSGKYLLGVPRSTVARSKGELISWGAEGVYEPNCLERLFKIQPPQR